MSVGYALMELEDDVTADKEELKREGSHERCEDCKEALKEEAKR